MKKIAVVMGTRPEAIKLAPVVRELARSRGARTLIVAAAQHRAMLDDALKVFGLRPDSDLNLMRRGQTPNDVLGRAVARTAVFLRRNRPDMLVVQGDTTAAAGAALAAFNEKIPVAHVEAGLRTLDLGNPFPEEGNRVLMDHLSSLCFAPTAGARMNLLREGIGRRKIVLTGNTAIDAVRWGRSLIRGRRAMLPQRLRSIGLAKRLVLVTLHRRESFGRPIGEIARGLKKALDAHRDALAFYPVHPNPEVRRAARRYFAHPRIILGPPLPYLSFLELMRRSYAILSDSGGIQEEAPVFHKPVLIAREMTERPEIVSARGGVLVGRDGRAVAAALNRIFDDRAFYERMASCKNPFGDGRAARRIADAIVRYLNG